MLCLIVSMVFKMSEELIDINRVVDEINQYAETSANNILQIGRVVYEAVKNREYGFQKKVIAEIKKNSNLKLNPFYVWQAFNAVRRRPELVYESTYKPNISNTQLLMLYNSNLSEGVVGMLEKQSELDKWTVRDLKGKIKEAKNELHPLSDDEKKRRELLKVIILSMKNLPIEKLTRIRISIAEVLE